MVSAKEFQWAILFYFIYLIILVSKTKEKQKERENINYVELLLDQCMFRGFPEKCQHNTNAPILSKQRLK